MTFTSQEIQEEFSEATRCTSDAMGADCFKSWSLRVFSPSSTESPERQAARHKRHMTSKGPAAMADYKRRKKLYDKKYRELHAEDEKARHRAYRASKKASNG